MISKKNLFLCISTILTFVIGLVQLGAIESSENTLSITNQSFVGPKEIKLRNVAVDENIGNVRKLKHVFKFTLGSPLGIALEGKVKGRYSLTFNPGLVYLQHQGNVFDEMSHDNMFNIDTYKNLYKYFTYGGYITSKVYLSKSKNPPSGWYVAIPIGVKYVTETEDSVENKFLHIGSAIGLGYQWIYPSGFVADLGFSYGANYASVDLNSGSFKLFDKIDKSDILMLFSLGVGYAY